MKYNLPAPAASALPDSSACPFGGGCLFGVLDLQAVNANGMVLHCRCPMEPLSEVVIGLQTDLRLGGMDANEDEEEWSKLPFPAHTITVRALVVSCRKEAQRGGQPCYEVTVAFEGMTSELRDWMENFRKSSTSQTSGNKGPPLFSWEAQERFGGMN